MEAHLDTDEANAAMVKDGDLLELIPAAVKEAAVTEKKAKYDAAYRSISVAEIDVKQNQFPDEPGEGALDLVTENAVRDAYIKGKTSIKKAPGALITPAAKDAALNYKIKIL
jgi:hypothetical protein